MDLSWMVNAACEGMDTETFYAETDTPDAQFALTVCNGDGTRPGCPILDRCRMHGLQHEPDGIWGGLTPYQRLKIRRRAGVDLSRLVVRFKDPERAA